MRICPRCKLSKPVSEFYSRRGKPGTSVYCKLCSCSQAVDRQRAIKLKCIEYKGGKCVKCGYDKSPAALTFHHTNPTKKDFTIAGNKLKSFENLKTELDKCLLLCSNCHNELHYNS